MGGISRARDESDLINIYGGSRARLGALHPVRLRGRLHPARGVDHVPQQDVPAHAVTDAVTDAGLRGADARRVGGRALRGGRLASSFFQTVEFRQNVRRILDFNFFLGLRNSSFRLLLVAVSIRVLALRRGEGVVGGWVGGGGEATHFFERVPTTLATAEAARRQSAAVGRRTRAGARPFPGKGQTGARKASRAGKAVGRRQRTAGGAGEATDSPTGPQWKPARITTPPSEGSSSSIRVFCKTRGQERGVGVGGKVTVLGGPYPPSLHRAESEMLFDARTGRRKAAVSRGGRLRPARFGPAATPGGDGGLERRLGEVTRRSDSDRGVWSEVGVDGPSV